MSVTGFPVDLILFGMIAAFLVLRLRSILGRRTGNERPAVVAVPRPAEAARAAKPAIDVRAEPVVAKPRVLPEPASPAGRALAAIAARDGKFSPTAFLAGAEQAFALIVGAYANGDREKLRPLLTAETFDAFDAAIAARQAAGETQRTELRGIHEATIEEATLDGVAAITIHFVSDQISVTLGRDGQVVAGTDAVVEIGDRWRFDRDLASADPAWRLAAARSA